MQTFNPGIQGLTLTATNAATIIEQRNRATDQQRYQLGIITTPLTLRMLQFDLYTVWVPALNVVYSDVPRVVSTIAENATGKRDEPLGIGTKVQLLFQHTITSGPVIVSAVASYGDISTLKTEDPNVNPNGYAIMPGVACCNPYVSGLKFVDIKVNSKVSAGLDVTKARMPGSVDVSCTGTGTTYMVQPQRHVTCIADQAGVNISALVSYADQERKRKQQNAEVERYLKHLASAKVDFSGKTVKVGYERSNS